MRASRCRRARAIALFLLAALAPAAWAEPAFLALLIDDLGYSRGEIRAVLNLPAPVGGAVLPHAPHSRLAAAELHRHGREVLLHLPMEALEGREAGPGALRRGMTPRELALTVDYDLATVPHATGINNHMGSLLTQDAQSMAVLMRHLRRGGLFFLDSRTSAQSVAHTVAQDHALPSLERDVFLDSERTPDAIRTQLARAISKARREGFAVAIGHPYPETLAILAQWLPTLNDQGIELVSLSQLLAHKVAHRLSPADDVRREPAGSP